MAAPLFAPAQAARPAQTAAAAEETAILEVVDRFMHAISNNDVAALTAIRIESGTNTVASSGPGETRVTRRPFQPGRARTGNATGTPWCMCAAATFRLIERAARFTATLQMSDGTARDVTAESVWGGDETRASGCEKNEHAELLVAFDLPLEGLPPP